MRHLVVTARPIAEDLAATALFYLLFLVTGSVALGAGVGLAVGGGQVVRHRRRKERVPGLLVMGIVLTILLGAASLVTQNPRFVLAKPSIFYAAIGATMLPSGWVLRYVPVIARDLLPRRTFDRVGWAWAALMFVTAAINIAALAAMTPHRAAITFAIWAATSKLALFTGQYAVLRPRAGRAYARRAALEGRGTLA